MSGSRAKLEQILELLLSEETERAEELLHEYVVAKARAEYEKVLEADDDLESSEEEIDADQEGDADMADDMDMGDDEAEGDDMDFDMGDEEEGEEGEEVEDLGDESEEADLEDKVEDLEDELEQLRAEFEELMAQEEGEAEHGDMGDEMDMGGDAMAFDMPKEGVAEATQFSKPASVQPMKGASMKGSEDDAANSKSPLSSKPKATTVAGAGAPVKSRDGGEGKHNHGGSVKDHTPTDNMDIEPKKASAPSKPE